MASKRQQIVEAIYARFQTILISGGYHTDAGTDVAIYRTTKVVPDSEQVAINIRDLSDRIDSTGVVPFDLHELHIETEFAVATGQTSDDKAREVIADIYSAIGKDHTWGGLAEGTILTRDNDNRMSLDQAERVVAGGYIDFIVSFRTDRFKEN
jgi:hypothetical protein